MIKNSASAITIFVFAFLLVFLTSEKHHYRYNLDVALSPVGMLMSKTYLTNYEYAPKNFQGYINDGNFALYNCWPPLGFKTLAFWFGITKDKSLESARIFSALVFGLNSALFFFLLIKCCRLSLRTSFMSSLVFSLLPSHLDYGDLIYSDIWFSTFWILALYFVDLARSKYYFYGVFVLTVFVGTFFFWFVFFLIPIPFLLKARQENEPKLILNFRRITILSTFVFLIQGILILIFSDVLAAQKLHKYSIYGVFIEFPHYFLRLLRRIGSLGYEMLCLIPLILILRRRKSGWVNIQRNIPINYLFWSTIIGLLIYVSSFFNWFVIHGHGIGMFAIPIALLVAHFLTSLEQISTKRMFLGAISATMVCILSYFSLPLLTNEKTQLLDQDMKIVRYMKSHTSGQEETLKSCFFMDMNERIGREVFIKRLAIADLTGNYPFHFKNTDPSMPLFNKFLFGLKKLENLGISDFDRNSFFLITENDTDFSGLEVYDSMSVNHLMIYHLGLK